MKDGEESGKKFLADMDIEKSMIEECHKSVCADNTRIRY